eukprot:UN10956
MSGEFSQERLSIAGGSYVVIRKDEHEIIAKKDRKPSLRCRRLRLLLLVMHLLP